MLATKNLLMVLHLIVVIGFLMSCKQAVEWTNYGGNKANNHYSSLAQIDTSNISTLKKAWEYHTGDADDKTQIQVNPLIIDGILYGVSPKLKLFALDAATGKSNGFSILQNQIQVLQRVVAIFP